MVAARTSDTDEDISRDSIFTTMLSFGAASKTMPPPGRLFAPLLPDGRGAFMGG
jgi:hypothetical protein